MPNQRWTDVQKRRARLIGGLIPVAGLVVALGAGVLWGQYFGPIDARFGTKTIVRLGIIAIVIVLVVGIAIAVLVDRLQRRRARRS